jgi:hypothetical protein
MTDPRSKSETLSKTAISYLHEWATQEIYGRRKEIKSKYFDKGNMVEAESIEFITGHLKLPFLTAKNEQFFENEHLTGTPDVILEDEIIDVKNPWDCFTFPLFEADLPNKDYEWQVLGYMALTGKKKARVIYTLMNTPHILLSTYGLTDDQIDQMYEDANYNNVPVKYRIKEYSVYYDQEKIDRIYERVEQCKIYLDSL